MKDSKKLIPSNDGAFGDVLSNNNTAKSVQNKNENLSKNEHKQSFEQLLDNAVLGIPNK
ncbi:MAG: hypothetical protein WBL28_04680 [Methylotenera sp.]